MQLLLCMSYIYTNYTGITSHPCTLPPHTLTPVVEIVLQDGHDGSHLTEEEHSMVCRVQLGQDSVQQLKLTGSSEQVGTETCQ